MVEISILVFTAIMLIRNWAVYSSNIYCIDNAYEMYKKLPSYNEMMINPRHWKRWTGKQWLEWLQQEKQNG